MKADNEQERTAECDALRWDLESYAEGELLESAKLARIRRHLASCSPCQDFLCSYDALTMGILSCDALSDPEGIHGMEPWQSDAPAHRARVSRIMDIVRLETSVREASSGRIPRGPREIEARLLELHKLSTRRADRLLWVAAALLLLAAGLGILFWQGPPGAPGPELSDALPATDEPAAAQALECTEEGDLRWTLGSAAQRQAEALRLYGFRGWPELVSRDVEWVVDAVPGRRHWSSLGTRFFLVEEGDPGLGDGASLSGSRATEIDPVRWFAPVGGRELGLVRAAGKDGRKGVYRVLVLPGPASLDIWRPEGGSERGPLRILEPVSSGPVVFPISFER